MNLNKDKFLISPFDIIKRYKKSKLSKDKKKWIRNNIFVFLLSLEKSEIDYCYDIFILILNFLELHQLMVIDYKDINRSKIIDNNYWAYSLLFHYTTSYVLLKVEKRKHVLQYLFTYKNIREKNIILFNDRTFCLDAIFYHHKAMEYIKQSFLDDYDFAIKAVELRANVYKILPLQFKLDEDICLKTLKGKKGDNSFIEEMFSIMKTNRKIVIEILKLEPKYFSKLNRKFKSDKEIIEIATEKIFSNYSHIPKILKKNKKYKEELFENDIENLNI